MAIINSVLIGKGRGKVGNLVLSNLKGQTILKSLNSSPSNPRSEDQTTQRSKMAYSVKVWQIVFLFMANFKSYIKPLESGYNAFIRNAIKVITTPVVFDFSSIWLSLVTAMDLKGNISLGLKITLTTGLLKASLDNPEISYNSSLTLNAMMVDKATKKIIYLSHEITEAEFASGEFDVHFEDLDELMCYFYVSSTATKQNTPLLSKEF